MTSETRTLPGKVLWAILGLVLLADALDMIDSTVTNWTFGDPRVRFRVPVGVAYGSDVDKVREALVAAGREHPQALQDPAPNVFLKPRPPTPKSTKPFSPSCR